MNYETFKKTMVEEIGKNLPSQYKEFCPVVETVMKVNEKKDAIIVKPNVENAAFPVPVLYLDVLYEMYLEAEDINVALEYAADMFTVFAESADRVASFDDFITQKQNIIPTVINTEKNRQLLTDVPHKDMLDMSVIYRILMKSPFSGYDSCVVTNSLLETFGFTLEELHELALTNLESVIPMEKTVVKGNNVEQIPWPFDNVTFVSSESGLFGSAYLTSETAMKSICEEMGCDEVFVVPLSINDFFLTPAKDIYLKALEDMLYLGNKEMENDKTFLSDNVYRYNRNDGALSKV